MQSAVGVASSPWTCAPSGLRAPCMQTPAHALVMCVGPLVDVGTPASTAAAASSGRLKRRRADSSSDSGKKRKPARTEAAPTRPPESALSDATWSRVQRMLASDKSLRSITRVTLAFFHEQETAQLRRAGIETLAHAVTVPLTEVYSMLSIGILKRVHDPSDPKISRFRRGHFLYHGKAGAIEWLQAIRTRARQLVGDARRVSPRVTRQKLDTILLNACNVQAQIEGWSHLTTTTVAFLTILLESDDGAVTSLGSISRRIVDARLVCDGDVPGKEEIARRVYDLVAVLASINAVVLSHLSPTQRKESIRRVGYATPRKGVAFNLAILSNPKLLRVGEMCSSQLEATMCRERAQAPETASEATNKPRPTPQRSFTVGSVALPNFAVGDDDHSLEDLFPDINPVEGSENVADWWNVALRGLLLRDALPLSDCLDWEIIQAISRARANLATSEASTAHTETQIEQHVDLTCHEELRA